MIASPPALQSELDAARVRTDELFDLLEPDFLYERPVEERNRLIFYLGHIEAFDWNQVCRGALGMHSFDRKFDELFEFGIDPEPGKLPSDRPSDWPALGEVRGYNAEIRHRLDAALADAPEQRVQVALEHRLMHAETFAYLLHNLRGEGFRPGHAREPVLSRNEPVATPMIHIPAGMATLGQQSERFGWDNEFPRHGVYVPEFAVSKHKVTHGDYLRFVERGARPPHFWELQDGQWFYRGMFGLTPLPLDWPVYITHAEAAAYAKWRGKTLMSEPQFHRAAYAAREGNAERPYPWGEEEPRIEHGNFDFHRWDPTSVTANPAGDSAYGVSQLTGNGWEWTSTPFGPFSGFKPFEFYRGYSANFFDNAHFVLKGGSPRTAACFLRASFRNWFRPNYPYVYAGFRLVQN